MRYASCSRCWCFSRATMSSLRREPDDAVRRVVRRDGASPRAAESRARRCRPRARRRSARPRDRRRAAAPAPASLRRADSVWTRPTGVSLTATSGTRGRRCSQLQHQPVGDDLDAGIALAARTSARSTAANARVPRSPPIARRQPLERRPHVGVGQRRAHRRRSPAPRHRAAAPPSRADASPAARAR